MHSPVANTLSETVLGVEPVAKAEQQRAWTRWLRRVSLFVLALWAVEFASPLVIAHSPLERWLTQRLQAAFGRPVEVRGYSLSLWSGPALEASSVTVEEDPRFGREYFLRAESLTVRLRLSSLLRGRVELGTLSLSHPSLNLVRNREGDWNLAEWLPRPASASGAVFVGPPAPQRALRFRRIEVNSGRINFKRGDEKLPFAFGSVNGTVESAGGGRWRLDLEAVPLRAAVIVQQPGILHLSGDLGGTSSRLRPAKLMLAWQGASISDVLRITRGYDYGVRGGLNLSMAAHTQGSGWQAEARAEFLRLHRWDLAARTDNPSVNIAGKVNVNLEQSSLSVDDATLDTANSQVRASLDFAWGQPPLIQKRPVSPVRISVARASVDLRELLAWARAFHPGIANDTALRGFAALKANAEGWPLHVVNMTLSSEGAALSGPRLRAPVQVGPIQSRYDHGGITLLPVALTLGLPSSSLHAEITTKPGPSAAPVLHLTANVAQVRDLIAAASALGWNLSRGWDVGGPMRCDLRWQGAGAPGAPWHTQPTGYLELGEAGPGGGASLRAPFINEPLEQIRARADIRPGVRHVSVTSAEAFSAHWNGTLDRANDEGWQFALSADHLSSIELDRWLNPRWRQSFLDRVLPFLNSSGASSAAPENLRASGRLDVDQFTLAATLIRKLAGNLRIEGRRLQLANARGELHGGIVSGDFDATLAAVPAYTSRLTFSRINLAALSVGSAAPGSFFGGTGSGDLSIQARGASRADLLASLTCHGSARVEGPEIRSFDLMASLRDAVRTPGKSVFREASATFTCAESRIRFQDLSFTGAAGEVSGSGTVDFTRNLDFRLRVAPDMATPRPARASYVRGHAFQLTGPLASPEMTQIAPVPQRR